MKINEWGEPDPDYEPKTRLLDSDDPLLAPYPESSELDKLIHFAHDVFKDMDSNSKFMLSRMLHRSMTTENELYDANVTSLLKWHMANKSEQIAKAFLYTAVCGYSTSSTNKIKRKEGIDYCEQIQALYEVAAEKLGLESTQ
jgi:hypothetical protein